MRCNRKGQRCWTTDAVTINRGTAGPECACACCGTATSWRSTARGSAGSGATAGCGPVPAVPPDPQGVLEARQAFKGAPWLIAERALEAPQVREALAGRVQMTPDPNQEVRPFPRHSEMGIMQQSSRGYIRASRNARHCVIPTDRASPVSRRISPVHHALAAPYNVSVRSPLARATSPSQSKQGSPRRSPSYPATPGHSSTRCRLAGHCPCRFSGPPVDPMGLIQLRSATPAGSEPVAGLTSSVGTCNGGCHWTCPGPGERSEAVS